MALVDTTSKVKSLFSYIEREDHGDYLGEAISQLEHALQAAYQAVESGADEETILGALLHDIGRYVPTKKDAPVMLTQNSSHGRMSHDKIGEVYLRGFGFSEKVCQLVGGHVTAKRYLTATEPEYYDSLSKSSKTTLKFQGGPMSKEEQLNAEKDPWLADKLNVRRWDDRAKNSDLKAPPISDYIDMAVKNLTENHGKVCSIQLHSREYNLPKEVTVVICVDGFDPEYLAQGIADGILPNIEKITKSGFSSIGKCAMPAFTNPNNVSIITGVPPSIHGIAGNFYLEKDTGKTRLVLDSTLLRGETILSELAKKQVRVAAVTAKDKLRNILSYGIEDHICFSSEKAGKYMINTLDNFSKQTVTEWMGREAPSMYSAELSLYVLDAGIKLIEERRADFLYLSLSDYVQHKHAPGSKEANDFYVSLDAKIGEILESGAVVGITGDHGMSDKSADDSKPNVIFLQDILDEKYGKGTSKVICPITDPFVGHHGALGGFVRVHLHESLVPKAAEIVELCSKLPHVELALSGEDAAEQLQMPADREGDLVVVSSGNAVIGASRADHDLSQLHGERLRSHGGFSEQDVPVLISKSCGTVAHTGNLRNFDVFYYALNCQ